MVNEKHSFYGTSLNSNVNINIKFNNGDIVLKDYIKDKESKVESKRK